VSGVRCQDDKEASLKKTACGKSFGRESFDPELTTEGLRTEQLSRADDNIKKTDNFLLSVIGLLTPDT
jgi:hypothetical protein